MSLRRSIAATFLATALLCSTVAPAAVYRVDDSGTVVGQPTTAMRWRKPAPGRAADDTVDGQLSVALRLNLQAWLNRRGRLYMGLEPAADGVRVQATWQTQGRLLPGSLRDGSRTLVYEGPITDPFLQESILLHLTTDGRVLERVQSLRFFFELEVLP